MHLLAYVLASAFWWNAPHAPDWPVGRTNVPDDAFQRRFLGVAPDQVRGGTAVFGRFTDEELDDVLRFVATLDGFDAPVLTILRTGGGLIEVNAGTIEGPLSGNGRRVLLRKTAAGYEVESKVEWNV